MNGRQKPEEATSIPASAMASNEYALRPIGPGHKPAAQDSTAACREGDILEADPEVVPRIRQPVWLEPLLGAAVLVPGRCQQAPGGPPREARREGKARNKETQRGEQSEPCSTMNDHQDSTSL